MRGFVAARLSPARRRGRRAAFRRAVRGADEAGPGFHRGDARRLHRRARLAGIRFPRREAGPARRPRAGHAPRAFPLELVPDDSAPRSGRAGELSRPEVLRAETERLLADPQVAPLRRGVSRLLDRPPQDGGLHAVDDTLQRLLSRRCADRGRDWRRRGSISTEMLQRDLPARHRRQFRFHVPQRAARDPLRHPRREGRRDAARARCRRTARAAAS